MDMKLWNFLERIQTIKNKVIYFENYGERDVPEGDPESVYLEINVEDADSETIEGSYILSAENKDKLMGYVGNMKKEYFEGEEIVENW